MSGRVVITGGAGLVGANLAPMLAAEGREVVVLDRNAAAAARLAALHPRLRTEAADLALAGDWERHLGPDAELVTLHAQISGKDASAFRRNTLEATANVLEAAKRRGTAFVVHVGSSVVHSAVEDDYVRSKREQERMVAESGLPFCVLRPTLMFGPLDPKHLGWLARFMERAPVFPVPGHGRYIRQPLYVRDFCRVAAWCLRHRPAGAVFDLAGSERIAYVEMIRAIRRARGLSTPIVHLPVPLFGGLLRLYALFSREPPFTADQLRSLTAGDEFTGVDLEATFGVRPTPFEAAVAETFAQPAGAPARPAR